MSTNTKISDDRTFFMGCLESEWQNKLRALCRGLEVECQDKLFDLGNAADFEALGKRIASRIREIKQEKEKVEAELKLRSDFIKESLTPPKFNRQPHDVDKFYQPDPESSLKKFSIVKVKKELANDTILNLKDEFVLLGENEQFPGTCILIRIGDSKLCVGHSIKLFERKND